MMTTESILGLHMCSPALAPPGHNSKNSSPQTVQQETSLVLFTLDGDTALIGSWYDDDNGANSGSAYVFTKSGVSLTFSITGGLG